MRPEAKFWDYLRDKLPGHVSRIENSIGNGMPDFNLCHDGIEIWVELKVSDELAPVVRKEQRVWGFNRSRSGGKCFVVALHNSFIYAWKHPNIQFEKVDDKYQRIVSSPSFICKKSEIPKLLEYLLLGIS